MQRSASRKPASAIKAFVAEHSAASRKEKSAKKTPNKREPAKDEANRSILGFTTQTAEKKFIAKPSAGKKDIAASLS